MGNSNSTGIQIKLDKPAYYPGESINAVIFINAPKPHLCSRIVLHIEGYEESQFRNQAGNGDLLNSQFVILRTFFVLKDFRSFKSYLHGQYEYPCTFFLPWTLPGSFKQQKGNYKAKIIYEIKVILVNPKSTKNNFEKIHEIPLRECSKQIDNYQTGKVSIYPKCLCFKNLGVCHVKCWFEKKNYLPNDNCVVICEIDNKNSKRQILRVKCEFKRTIFLKSTNGFKKQIKQTLNTVEFMGAAKGQSLIGPLSQRISLPLRYKNTKIGVLPSTSGNLVRCEYSIEVTPEVGGCFTKGNQTFVVNLQILQPNQIHNLKKPQKWQPSVENMSKIQLIDKDEKQMRQSVIITESEFAADDIY